VVVVSVVGFAFGVCVGHPIILWWYVLLGVDFLGVWGSLVGVFGSSVFFFVGGGFFLGGVVEVRCVSYRAFLGGWGLWGGVSPFFFFRVFLVFGFFFFFCFVGGGGFFFFISLLWVSLFFVLVWLFFLHGVRGLFKEVGAPSLALCFAI